MTKLVTIAEAARETGLSAHMVKKLIADGKVRHFRLGNQCLVDWSELQSHVEDRLNAVQNRATRSGSGTPVRRLADDPAWLKSLVSNAWQTVMAQREQKEAGNVPVLPCEQGTAL